MGAVLFFLVCLNTDLRFVHSADYSREITVTIFYICDIGLLYTYLQQTSVCTAWHSAQGISKSATLDGL